MMALMRRAKVPRLRIDRGFSIRCFLEMNPDQCEHLRRIYQAHNHTVHTVHELVRRCGWEKSRPELLSMIACFAGDSGLRDSDFDEFDEDRWWSAYVAARRNLKFNPHCVPLAESMR